MRGVLRGSIVLPLASLFCCLTLAADALSAPKYLVIAPRSLVSSVKPLCAQKRARGYEVVVKTVEDFARPGRPPSPDAMRRYVLGQSPTYLLLVGDGDRTPGYPMPATSGSGAYVSDAYLSMEPSDIVPRALTGRISSNDPTTVANICRRLVAYPVTPAGKPRLGAPLRTPLTSPKPWRSRVILTGWLPRGPEVPLTDPGRQADAGWGCMAEIGFRYKVVKEFEYKPGCSAQAAQYWGATDSTKASLRAAIEQGAVIVRYLGHGSERAWSNIGSGAPATNEDFTVADVLSLRISRTPPLVISAACLTGKISASPCLAEAWQTSLNAIGVFAADPISATFWNDRITQRIFHQIVRLRTRPIGRALVEAMRAMHAECSGMSGFIADGARMYRYFGDPDTVLADVILTRPPSHPLAPVRPG